MTSDEYRQIIKRITINTIRKNFPGLKKSALEQTGADVARATHARMYGANVDGVDSPIWALGPEIDRGNRYQHDVIKLNPPNVDAAILLKEEP